MSHFERDYYEAEAFWDDQAFLSGSNAARIRETASMIPADVRTMADVGCGNAAFGNYLQQHHPRLDVLSVDRSVAALSHAKTRTLAAEINALPLGDRSYDLVSCLQVLEHIPVPAYEPALRELARVASRYLLVSVPFEERIEDNVTRCPSCKSVFNADLHLRSYDNDAFRCMFSASGWRLAEQRRVVPGSSVVGMETYQKLKHVVRNGSATETFRSPICPICGLRNDAYAMATASPASTESQAVTPLRALKSWVVARLPRRSSAGYWMVGLFVRS